MIYAKLYRTGEPSEYCGTIISDYIRGCWYWNQEGHSLNTGKRSERLELRALKSILFWILVYTCRIQALGTHSSNFLTFIITNTLSETQSNVLTSGIRMCPG